MPSCGCSWGLVVLRVMLQWQDSCCRSAMSSGRHPWLCRRPGPAQPAVVCGVTAACAARTTTTLQTNLMSCIWMHRQFWTKGNYIIQWLNNIKFKKSLSVLVIGATNPARLRAKQKASCSGTGAISWCWSWPKGKSLSGMLSLFWHRQHWGMETLSCSAGNTVKIKILLLKLE